ncbi:MAG: hypothetical protein HYZ28_04135 [Myxococcales bacterium]|nr:hypothetical protein [Myxococcales bacterium]
MRRVPLSLLLGAALLGCPQPGTVCRQDLERCGTTCADFQSDPGNCGACGRSCTAGEVCANGACKCRPGSTACEGRCINFETDPQHCGDCGKPCATGEVCEARRCKAACELGTSTFCDGSCADLSTDPNHCGQCGRACEGPQSCHQGICTFDLVAACSSVGEVAGIQARTDSPTRSALGTRPTALAVLHDLLLAADGIDQRLHQARLSTVGGASFAPYPSPAAIVPAPSQVLVDDPYVYVLGRAQLQVLQRGGATPSVDGGVPSDAGADAGLSDAGSDAGEADAGPMDAGEADAGGVDGGGADAGLWASEGEPIHSPIDGGHFPGGPKLVTVATLDFGPDAFASGMAKLGKSLFVALRGAADGGGQRVLKVDVTTPEAPAVADSFELGALSLKSFDGGVALPRPSSLAVQQGALYVALGNLDPPGAPAGPGMLARIDLSTRNTSTIDLGEEDCLDAAFLASDGERLYVSCQGAALRSGPPDFALLSATSTGVVLVADGGAPASAWAMRCPDAGACIPPQAGHLALFGGKLYVADQNGGRLFVLETQGGQLVERRGTLADAGPIQACPTSPGSASSVDDVLAVP